MDWEELEKIEDHIHWRTMFLGGVIIKNIELSQSMAGYGIEIDPILYQNT